MLEHMAYFWNRLDDYKIPLDKQIKLVHLEINHVKIDILNE